MSKRNKSKKDNYEYIEVDFTPEELARVKENAKAVNMNISDFIMWAAKIDINKETLIKDGEALLNNFDKFIENPNVEDGMKCLELAVNVCNAAHGLLECDKLYKKAQNKNK